MNLLFILMSLVVCVIAVIILPKKATVIGGIHYRESGEIYIAFVVGMILGVGLALPRGA